MLSLIVAQPVHYRGANLEPGQGVIAPLAMIDVIAELVERGDVRPADAETRRLLREAAAGRGCRAVGERDA